jgi:pSer/pThr/pTyr-binding forkhead associated (FHA) protein
MVEQARPGIHTASPSELQRRLHAERLGAPFMMYLDAEGHEQLHTLDEASVRKLTLGRSLDADIGLPWDREVSTVHAELERVGEGWAIVDDGLSHNGTWVNNARLNGRRRLRDGDVLRLGRTVVIYRAPSEDASRTVTSLGDVGPARLSETQRRVLIALCRPFKPSGGYVTPATNQQIAGELFLSVDAVKTHLKVLFQKFGVEDLPQNQKRTQLVDAAFRTGAVTMRDL